MVIWQRDIDVTSENITYNLILTLQDHSKEDAVDNVVILHGARVPHSSCQYVCFDDTFTYFKQSYPR